MKKIIIIGFALAAITTAAILITKHMKKQKIASAPANLPEKKQTIMQEIMDLVADMTKMDIVVNKIGLAKLTEGELASLKIAFLDYKNAGSESGMSAANKKVMAELIPKLYK